MIFSISRYGNALEPEGRTQIPSALKTKSKAEVPQPQYHPLTFQAIQSGVLNRLSKLTSKSKVLEDIKIDTIYPDHAKALQIAGIAPKSS